MSAHTPDAAVELLRRIEHDVATSPPPRALAMDRLVGRLIDLAIVYTLIIAVSLAVLPSPQGPPLTEVDRPWGFSALSWTTAWQLLLLAVIFVAYDLVTTGLFGATPGKRYAGTRIVAPDRAPLPFRRMLLRTSLWAVPMALTWASASVVLSWSAIAVCALLAWRVVRDPNRVGWHDRLAGSLVVDRGEPEPAGRAP